MAFFVSIFCLFNCPPFFIFPPFAGVWIEHWHGGFERFSHPGFKFLACSYSDGECQEGERVRYRSWESLYTCLQFCFEGRNQAGFVSIEIFQTFIGGFETSLFFIFCFCRLLLLLCFGLHFAVLFVAFDFCDFDVSVNLTGRNLDFTLFLFSLWERKRSHF